jgi:cell filamentation protein
LYEAHVDPYCYKGTNVLKNRLGLRDQSRLDAFEADATAQRFSEALPAGNLDIKHYCAVHRHIFGDIYRWAGCFRTIRISRNSSMFCYPENIASEMARIFRNPLEQAFAKGLPLGEFGEKAAHCLAELNAVHPFRDGNGRTQLAFLALIARHAGHPLNFEKLEVADFLEAIIASFNGHEDMLAQQIITLAT